MCSPGLLVGPDHAQRAHDLLVLGLGRPHQSCKVIAVRNGDPALAGCDRAQLIRIAPLGCAGKVGNQSARPSFGLRLSMVGDQRRAQRQVVRVRAGAHADLSLQTRCGQILVGLKPLRTQGCLVVDDHAGTGRKRHPGRRAHRCGNARFDDRRLDRLEQAGLVGDLEARCVDGDQQVGRAAGAFALEAFEQFVLLAVEPIDLDAGLLGEVGVQRLVGLVVAGRVDVEYSLRARIAETEQSAGRSRDDDGVAEKLLGAEHGGDPLHVAERGDWPILNGIIRIKSAHATVRETPRATP